MCIVWNTEQTAIISLYSINWLVCIAEMESVYCAVRTGYLTIIRVNICLWSVKIQIKKKNLTFRTLKVRENVQLSLCVIKYESWKPKVELALCLHAFLFSEFDLHWQVSSEARQLYHSGKNKSTHSFRAVEKRKCLLLSKINADPPTQSFCP